MNEPFIDTTGPSLGALSIYLRSNDNTGSTIMKPIWRLYNHQGPDWQYAQALIKEPNDAVSLSCVYSKYNRTNINIFISFRF